MTTAEYDRMRVRIVELEKLVDYIEDNSCSAGGGTGFALSLWVPSDHESITCGIIDAANSVEEPSDSEAEFVRRASEMTIRNSIRRRKQQES